MVYSVRLALGEGVHKFVGKYEFVHIYATNREAPLIMPTVNSA